MGPRPVVLTSRGLEVVSGNADDIVNLSPLLTMGREALFGPFRGYTPDPIEQMRALAPPTEIFVAGRVPSGGLVYAYGLDERSKVASVGAIFPSAVHRTGSPARALGLVVYYLWRVRGFRSLLCEVPSDLPATEALVRRVGYAVVRTSDRFYRDGGHHDSTIYLLDVEERIFPMIRRFAPDLSVRMWDAISDRYVVVADGNDLGGDKGW